MYLITKSHWFGQRIFSWNLSQFKGEQNSGHAEQTRIVNRYGFVYFAGLHCAEITADNNLPIPKVSKSVKINSWYFICKQQNI